jgi:hypothetical protein
LRRLREVTGGTPIVLSLANPFESLLDSERVMNKEVPSVLGDR